MSVDEPSKFIFVICQSGANAAARDELLASPSLNLAFSRPGFLTFKVVPDHPLPERFALHSTLARTYGWCVGKVAGQAGDDLIQQVLAHPEFEGCQHLHVFEREVVTPGTRGFEPGITPLAAAVADKFAKAIGDTKPGLLINRVAQPDERIFDVVLVSPDEWWLGFHFGTTRPLRWPGGVPQFADHETEVISRAYFKLSEALLWSGITIRPGDVCCEIGSAPGGACQLLLEKGARVIAVDPAEMDAQLMEHPHLTHLRRRGKEIRKKDLKQVRWLLADLNIAPNYTLDTVQEIVSHDQVNVTGMILTLKLTDWELVKDIPANMQRVKEMGFGVVKARQLAFDRQEYCLVAVKDKFALRASKRKPGKSIEG